jgi:hypothetical protein
LEFKHVFEKKARRTRAVFVTFSVLRVQSQGRRDANLAESPLKSAFSKDGGLRQVASIPGSDFEKVQKSAGDELRSMLKNGKISSPRHEFLPTVEFHFGGAPVFRKPGCYDDLGKPTEVRVGSNRARRNVNLRSH